MQIVYKNKQIVCFGDNLLGRSMPFFLEKISFNCNVLRLIGKQYVDI